MESILKCFVLLFFMILDQFIGNLYLKAFVLFFIVFLLFRIGFFIGNIIHARYQYSRYDFYIHHRAQKPWNNWGLNSLT